MSIFYYITKYLDISILDTMFIFSITTEIFIIYSRGSTTISKKHVNKKIYNLSIKILINVIQNCENYNEFYIYKMRDLIPQLYSRIERCYLPNVRDKQIIELVCLIIKEPVSIIYTIHLDDYSYNITK